MMFGNFSISLRNYKAINPRKYRSPQASNWYRRSIWKYIALSYIVLGQLQFPQSTHYQLPTTNKLYLLKWNWFYTFNTFWVSSSTLKMKSTLFKTYFYNKCIVSEKILIFPLNKISWQPLWIPCSKCYGEKLIKDKEFI